MFECTSTARFSISVNGSICGFFEFTNELCQGDPLSPALFVIMSEVIEKPFNRWKQMNRWNGIRVAEGVD